MYLAPELSQTGCWQIVVGLLERPSSERHLDRVKYNSVLKSFEQYLTNVMERYLLPAKKKMERGRDMIDGLFTSN